ncbi:hypothetical protein [Streptomyces sp. bgisy060]|uniref:hypothetical protein n=1 Tax=Streptomyces sp. bgisy060 TaxID=3413775 RepID=UPI003EBF6673
MTENPITIVRGRGGEVEADGPIDSLASELIARAGFIRQYTTRGVWHRLPFDMGEEWENAHASHAAEMLSAARYPVSLAPSLSAPPHGSDAGVPSTIAAAARTLKSWSDTGDQLRQPHEAGRVLAALAQGEDSLLRPSADLLLAAASTVSALPGPAHHRDARRLAELSAVLRVVEIEADRIALRLRSAADLAPAADRGPAPAPIKAPAKLQDLVRRLNARRTREYQAQLPVQAPAPSSPGRSR